MKISGTKYYVLALTIWSFFSIDVLAQNNSNENRIYGQGYWDGYDSGYDDGYDYGYNNKPTIERPEQSFFDVAPICFGMGVGIASMIAYNYFRSWQDDEEEKNLERDDTKTDDQPNRSTPLSFEKRVEILENAFRPIEKLNLNIPLIACLTAGYSRSKIEKFLKIAKRSVIDYNINFAIEKDTDAPIYSMSLITMDYVNLAIDEMDSGSPKFDSLDTKRIVKTAIHEAGHAIAIIHTEELILHSVSIINRAQSIGRCIFLYTNEQKSWTLEDYKNNIIISLCGGLAEQVFGFDKSWYEGRYPVGAEQAFDECCLLAQNKNISKGLADLLAIPGAIGDMMHARKTALYIAKRYIEMQASEQDKDDKHGQIQNHQCKILEECYQRALKLIQSHKPTIEKISQLLMKQDIISGNAVYALCNVDRPLYGFEK